MIMKNIPRLETSTLVLAATLLGACVAENGATDIDGMRHHVRSETTDIFQNHTAQANAEDYEKSRLAGSDIQLKGSQILSFDNPSLPSAIQKVRNVRQAYRLSGFQNDQVHCAVKVTVIFQETSNDPPAETVFTVLLDSEGDILAMAGEE